MDQESDVAAPFEEAQYDQLEIRPISDWIWKPWYAKLWWALIPVYWAGAMVARSSIVDDFYSSALAGVINVLMFPPAALLLLGAGYLRERIGPIEWVGSSTRGPSVLGHEIGRPPRAIDPLNPSAGAYWIGSPTNPLNPANQQYRRNDN